MLFQLDYGMCVMYHTDLVYGMCVMYRADLV